MDGVEFVVSTVWSAVTLYLTMMGGEVGALTFCFRDALHHATLLDHESPVWE